MKRLRPICHLYPEKCIFVLQEGRLLAKWLQEFFWKFPGTGDKIRLVS